MALSGVKRDKETEIWQTYKERRSSKHCWEETERGNGENTRFKGKIDEIS